MGHKKVLVLGSGMVARPVVDYLLRRQENEVTVGQRLRPLCQIRLQR